MTSGIISPVMLKTFKKCPQKYILKYIQNITMPNIDKTFEIGKNIHALASYKLKNFNIVNYEEKLNKKENENWEYLKNNKYFQLQPLYSEYNLSCKIGEYWIGGRIDAIVTEENNYIILDYKTGGITDDMTFDYQTIVYLLCCDKYFKDKKFLKFVYIDLKNKKDIIINFNDELRHEYTNIIIQTCDEMTNLKNYTKNCNNNLCEYSKICNKFLIK